MNQTEKKTAGRKATDGAKGVKGYRVTLDQITFLYLRELGTGQLSRGIRKAARLIMKM